MYNHYIFGVKIFSCHVLKTLALLSNINLYISSLSSALACDPKEVLAKGGKHHLAQQHKVHDQHKCI